MKVADYVIQFLADKGIEVAFVVNGAANAYLIDGFVRAKGIRYIATMHEQGAGFAAEGYAKVTGKPGVAIATSGPGGMNLVTPLGNFYYDSIPGLFFTGQINSEFLKQDESIRQIGFQETDIVGIVKPVTKYAKQIMKAQDIRYELEKAYFLATERRPGPVLLDIPQNIQKQEIDPNALLGFDPLTMQPNYDVQRIERQVDEYLTDLKNAKRPVLMIGGGVQLAGAVQELLELGRKLKIPMFPTWNAIDVVASDYEYYGGRIGTYGGRGRNFGIQNSDLLLAIGSRIPGRITGGNVSSFARAAKKYVVDVEEGLLQRKWQQVPFDVNVYSDAKLFIEILTKKLAAYTVPDFSAWMKQVADWRDKYDPVIPAYYEQKNHTNPYVFIRILSEEMKKNDIYVVDCGGNVVVSNQAFETKQGQRYMSNNGNSPMGFSYAGALGAYAAAKPGQSVVCVIGDGGFNMNIQELQTMKVYGLKPKTFIMNNHIYGIIKAFQETNVEGRYEGSEAGTYVPPDFLKICEAYGVKTATMDTNDVEKIRAQIREILAADEAIVCDVNCDGWYDYSPRIFGWKTPIEDMYPYLPREEFRANMMIDPIEGWETPQMPGTATAKKVGTME